MQYTKEIVKFGPRPIGSANHKKVEDYIASHLKGDNVEDDNFTADTPAGKFPVHNIVAKFPGTKDGVILIASHYDTNYPLRDTAYVGANDGASSSALLLELANQLREKRRDGYTVWLIWDDAEEAMVSDT
jgi:Zn-dependent M28 family amino/carboxypeptidase